MADDRIVKITNISKENLPAHKPGSVPTCTKYGCAGCAVPTWNRIEFPMKAGETIVVKENVGSHLVKKFKNQIKVTAGPFDTTQLLQSPDGFFEHDVTTGKYKPLQVKTNTSPLGSSQDPNAEGENDKDVKAKDRFLVKGER